MTPRLTYAALSATKSLRSRGLIQRAQRRGTGSCLAMEPTPSIIVIDGVSIIVIALTARLFLDPVDLFCRVRQAIFTALRPHRTGDIVVAPDGALLLR